MKSKRRKTGGRKAAPLTEMDLRVFDVVAKCIREQRDVPAYKEIAARIGHASLSTGNIARAMGKLERAGKLVRVREIRIVEGAPA